MTTFLYVFAFLAGCFFMACCLVALGIILVRKVSRWIGGDE